MLPNRLKSTKHTEYLVSCIVPVLNEKETIQDYIISLHNQDFRPIELIIVDGGSVDGTVDIIKRAMEDLNDDRFSVKLFKERDFGTITSPANARNIGLDASTGQYIFFIDSDTCFITKSTLKAAISEMNNRDFIIIYFEPLIENKFEEYISKTMKLDGIIVYRKKLIKNMRFISTLGFGEDREFNFRLFRNFGFYEQIPCSETIGRHYPHSRTELKRQNEWYGRTIIRYLRAIYSLNKKEFLRQLSYLFYNILMALYPFITIISLGISIKLTFILILIFAAQIFIRFLNYNWNKVDQYVFLVWYSIFNGLFFTKGLISSICKENSAGRKS